MAENQEQIESRLCGYVDETLDLAENAEIEEHLRAHPQHRQMLSELRKMRDALRDLPRESAPAELSESFTGQLERSVLLDGIGQQPAERRMRITRMPQLAAIAAIALLAVGLGFVIYIALPPSKTPIAQNTHGPVVPPNIDGGEVVLKAPSAPIEPSAAPDKGSPTAAPVISAAASPTPEGNNNSSLAEAGATPQMAAVANSALANNSVRALLGETDRALPSGRPTLVMIVATADPAATTRKLGSYLETSNADWQSAAALDVDAKAGEPAFGNGRGQEVAGGVGGSNGASGAPGAAGIDKTHGVPSTMPQTRPDAFAYAADANTPTTAPFGDAEQSQMTSNAMQQKIPIDNKSLKDLQNQLSDNDDRLYVVRNLSFEQAKKLNDLLRQGGGQTAAPLFADRAEEDGALDTGKIRESRQQLEQTPLASQDEQGHAATQPSTRPQADDMTKQEAQRLDAAATTQPQTNPADMAFRAVAPIDNQALLGSSPVDLVIVIQSAPVAAVAAPATNPATNPAPAPAPTTAPATQP
jgi:hypothetical protein